jgi:hypothetical protein
VLGLLPHTGYNAILTVANRVPTSHPGDEEGPTMRFELLRDRRILLVTADGPLEKEDFERLANEVDPIIVAGGKLAGLLVQAKSFLGWENLDGFISHIKFIAGHHRQIERVAVVTDSSFLKVMPRITGYFVHPEIRQFDINEKEQALEWLGSDQ